MPTPSPEFAQILPGVSAEQITCTREQFQEANRILLVGGLESNSSDPSVRRIIDLARAAYLRLVRSNNTKSPIHKGLPVGLEVVEGEAGPSMSIGRVMRLLSDSGDERLNSIAEKTKRVYAGSNRANVDSALAIGTRDFSLINLTGSSIVPSEIHTSDEAYALLRRLDNSLKVDMSILTDLETLMRTLTTIGALRASAPEIAENGLEIVKLAISIFENKVKLAQSLSGKNQSEDASDYFFASNLVAALPTAKQLNTSNIGTAVEPATNKQILTGRSPSMWMPKGPYLASRLKEVQDTFATHSIHIGMMNVVRILDYLAEMDMTDKTTTAFDFLGNKRVYLQTASKFRVGDTNAPAFIIVDCGTIKVTAISKNDVDMIRAGNAELFTPVELKLK